MDLPDPYGPTSAQARSLRPGLQLSNTSSKSRIDRVENLYSGTPVGSRKSSSTLVALVKVSPGQTKLDNLSVLGLDIVTFDPIVVGEEVKGQHVPFDGHRV